MTLAQHRQQMTVRDRLRSLTDERRWREYQRTATAIFLRAQPDVPK